MNNSGASQKRQSRSRKEGLKNTIMKILTSANGIGGTLSRSTCVTSTKGSEICKNEARELAENVGTGVEKSNTQEPKGE